MKLDVYARADMAFTKADMDRAYLAGREAGLYEARELVRRSRERLDEALVEASDRVIAERKDKR